MLRFMGSQRVGHDWATDLIWSDLILWIYLSLSVDNHKGFDLGRTWGIWFRSYLNGLVVFPTFFNLSLNFAVRSSWTEPQSVPVLFLLNVSSFSTFGYKEYKQSDFSIDHLVMSVSISCVVGRGCLLWPVCSLGKTLSAFVLLHFVLQGQTCLLLKYLLTSYFCIPVPYVTVTY